MVQYYLLYTYMFFQIYLIYVLFADDTNVFLNGKAINK